MSSYQPMQLKPISDELQAHSLWYPSLATYTFNPPPAHTIVPPTQARHHHLSRHGHTNVQPRTMLSTLLADERAVELRKANVRRFGAGWIKPPGLSKTLQGMQDEQAEREEQEAVAERCVYHRSNTTMVDRLEA